MHQPTDRIAHTTAFITPVVTVGISNGYNGLSVIDYLLPYSDILSVIDKFIV